MVFFVAILVLCLATFTKEKLCEIIKENYTDFFFFHLEAKYFIALTCFHPRTQVG